MAMVWIQPLDKDGKLDGPPIELQGARVLFIERSGKRRSLAVSTYVIIEKRAGQPAVQHSFDIEGIEVDEQGRIITETDTEDEDDRRRN